MKKAVLPVLIVLVLLFAAPFGSEAQMRGPKGMPDEGMMGGGCCCGCGMMSPMACGMMGGRMGGGMMGRGMMGGGMMRGMMGEHRAMMHMCMEHLGLNDKQKEEISAIRISALEGVIRKRADMQIARLELSDLLSKEPVDMKAVEAKVRQIEGLRTDIHLAIIKMKEDIKSKLTPEQLKKMKEMMHKRPMMSSTGDENEMQPSGDMQDTGEPAQPQPEQMENMD